ncbi:MAG: 5-carboxymethyl-2-hydroxymuconate isomerase, partial [Desulfobacula sp.]|nr:5-carboxymethyl-2-hydroxymuconate isomerase [Desulfobacula sp.]
VFNKGTGRDIEIRKAVADRIFETLTGFLQPIYDKRYLSIGCELIELHPVLTYKKNNIEQKNL